MSGSESPRATASRGNGKRSRGPKTEAGKAASSRNALRHGLRTDSVVLPSESQAEWDSHRAAIREALNPCDRIEEICAERVAYHTWKLRRAARAETAAIASQYDGLEGLIRETLPHGRRDALVLEDRALAELLHRYEAYSERAFWRSLAELRSYRAGVIEHGPDPLPPD